MIKINCDVGEGLGNERSLFKYITACSIACGGHAGDEKSMRETLALAKEMGVAAGAHPSYPDKENFGRVSMDISEEELIQSVRQQIDLLISLADEQGLQLDHIKAHGALYNDAAKDERIAKVFLDAIEPYNLPIYISWGSEIARQAKEREIEVVYEAFADRNYNLDLTLIPRSEVNAMIKDPWEVIGHVNYLLMNVIRTPDQKFNDLKVETICLHSDSEQAELLARFLFGRYQLKVKSYGDQGYLIEWPQKMAKHQLYDIIHFKEQLRKLGFKVTQGVASLLVQGETTEDNLWAMYVKAPAPKKRSIHQHIIPVCYDQEFGEDLKLMSQELGLSTEEIINIHSKGSYTVYAMGFLPGFMYLGGLDERLHIPRKSEPRIRIPKGSVGIGGSQTGIYPQESPGGWQLIGRTPIDLFNAKSNPPSAFQEGDEIKFEPVSKEEFLKIEQEVQAGSYQHRMEVMDD